MIEDERMDKSKNRGNQQVAEFPDSGIIRPLWLRFRLSR